ncbi:MAG: flagellar hook-associated protein FlgK [Rhodothermales bacterium]|nr:flagellar hook-associated protein FlgK [Rhodothermales bacterium]
MSINQLIELTRRSFRTTSAVINTIGQNIANENTEGFSRRRVTLESASSASAGVQIYTPMGSATGIGVSINDIDRVRDQVLAAATWEANAGLGASDEEARIMSALENLFPINSDASLSNLLNNFWNGWSDVADTPTNLSARVSLQNRAESLALAMNRISTDIDRLQDDSIVELAQTVEDFNTRLDELARLNQRIASGRAGNAPDLAGEDRRDQLIKEMSEMAPLQVRVDDQHMYNVTIQGMVVLQGDTVEHLELDTSGVLPTLSYETTGISFNPTPGDDGRLGALMRALTVAYPDARQELDDLAAALVDRINTLHSGGFGINGSTGLNFFDPAGVTAGSIALSADIDDPRAIAASDDPDPTVQSDNDVALAILAERLVDQAGLGNQTFENHAVNLTSGIGAQVERANDQYEGHLAVVNYLGALERGVSAVSINDELANLILYQQTFAAAARVLGTAQTMMDTLLALP